MSLSSGGLGCSLWTGCPQSAHTQSSSVSMRLGPPQSGQTSGRSTFVIARPSVVSGAESRFDSVPAPAGRHVQPSCGLLTPEKAAHAFGDVCADGLGDVLVLGGHRGAGPAHQAHDSALGDAQQ